jgi:hypothetical protein
MKSLTLIFYGTDGDAAKALAGTIRKDGGSAQLRHAYAFDGEVEPADRVALLPCVTPHDVTRLKAAFGDKVAPAGLPLPPPPPPLVSIPEGWRKLPVPELKALAASVGGRAVENADQAVQVIQAALATK